MSNILISGAYGFVGSNISKYLTSRNKYNLSALDLTYRYDSNYIEYVKWDNVANISSGYYDVIIHLAGKAHDTKNKSKSQEYFDINLGLTQLIFDQFLLSNARVFIFFSSVKAVADSVKDDILTEDAIPEPLTPYGQSKLAAENYILSKKLPPQKKIYILRPAMIHGPGNKGNLNLLYKFVKRGIPYPLGLFENQRSFTSIGNINFIIENLIEKNIDSGIYNVADSGSLSTIDIIKLISTSLGKKPKIWNISVPIVKLIAKLFGILGLPINSETIKKLTETYLVSNKKIIEAIKSELPYTVRTGLEFSLKSFNNK